MSIDYLVIFCLSNLHDLGWRDDQLHLHLQRIRGIVSAALAVFPEEGSPPPSSTADAFFMRVLTDDRRIAGLYPIRCKACRA